MWKCIADDATETWETLQQAAFALPDESAGAISGRSWQVWYNSPPQRYLLRKAASSAKDEQKSALVLGLRIRVEEA